MRLPKSGRALKHQIRKRQISIIKSVEKKLKIVPKHYYQKYLAMAIGMAGFGIPLGVAIRSQVLTTWLFLGVGIPIGSGDWHWHWYFNGSESCSGRKATGY
jgi:hypothetical protein